MRDLGRPTARRSPRRPVANDEGAGLRPFDRQRFIGVVHQSPAYRNHYRRHRSRMCSGIYLEWIRVRPTRLEASAMWLPSSKRRGTMMRSTMLAAAASVGASIASPAQESPVTLDTKTGALHGTLLMPAGATSPVPVALLIAGSGPTDRDGNSPLLPGKNNSLKLLAEGLAQHGIASLRYDKR